MSDSEEKKKKEETKALAEAAQELFLREKQTAEALFRKKLRIASSEKPEELHLLMAQAKALFRKPSKKLLGIFKNGSKDDFFGHIADDSWKELCHDWIAKARSGDREAGKRLFSTYYGFVKYEFLGFIVGVYKPDPEDIHVALNAQINELADEVFEKMAALIDAGFPSARPDYFEFVLKDLARRHWNDLAYAANRGDADAFNRLFDICRPSLEGLVRSHAGTGSPLAIVAEKEGAFDRKKGCMDDLWNTLYLFLRENEGAIYTPHFPLNLHFKNILTSFVKYRLKTPDAKIVKGSDLRVTDMRRPGHEPALEDVENEADDDGAAHGHVLSDGKKPGYLKEQLRKYLAELKIYESLMQYLGATAYPHRFFAFTFNDWLGIKPQAIWDGCRHRIFGELLGVLVSETRSKFPRDSVEAWFDPARDKLGREVREVYGPANGHYSKLVACYGNDVAGNLTFTACIDHIGRAGAANPAQVLSGWRYASMQDAGDEMREKHSLDYNEYIRGVE